MNLLLLPEQVDRWTLSARDRRLEHVRGVLRLRVGDSFDVGAANGPRGKATIAGADAESVELAIAWGSLPPPPPPLDLLVGLPRPATAKKIVTEGTTLGARSIHFFPTGKTDPAYSRSRFWSNEEWRAARQLGAEQAFTTWLPPVFLHDSLQEALKAVPPGTRRFAMDVYEATTRFSTEVEAGPAGTTLAMGPERGWNGSDRSQLRDAGFVLCSLGERVLRVETALFTAMVVALLRLGRL